MSSLSKVRRSGGYSRSQVWNKLRVQTGGAILFAVVLPTLVMWLGYPKFIESSSVQLAAIGTAIAACASVFMVRNMALHPGIQGSFFAFPAVILCFTITFSVFLFLRIDYSRGLFIGGWIGTLVWLYVAQIMVERGPPLRVGVVPFGDVAMLAGDPKLELHWLTDPRRDASYDMLVADFRADLPDEWEAFLADCALARLPVLHVKQLHESLTGRVEIEHLTENSFGSLIPFVGYLRLRRIIDFGAAVIALILLAPFLIIVGLLIKLDSRGPLLFRQVRVGYGGAPFRVFKFRTMIPSTDRGDARSDAITQDSDRRITRLGRFLRRTRIDELPQLINVIRGEMSWIGPRPEAEVLSRWYESELPFYRYRHIVPPGITGWAQVNQGHVAELDQVMNKLHYDFYYIKHFSPWLDALIVAKTIHTVITGFGSR